MSPGADQTLTAAVSSAVQATAQTYLGPVVPGPSVWVEVEDNGAGG